MQPQQSVTPKTLEALRKEMEETVRHILSNPDKKVHIIKGEPGLGKTYQVSRQIIGKKALWLAHMHKQLDEVVKNFTEHEKETGESVDYIKWHPMEGINCPHYDIIEELLQKGFRYSKLICTNCKKVDECLHKEDFKLANKYDILLAPLIYVKTEDFFNSFGNDKREFVIMDEDPTNYIMKDIFIDYRDLLDYRDFCAVNIDKMRAHFEICVDLENIHQRFVETTVLDVVLPDIDHSQEIDNPMWHILDKEPIPEDVFISLINGYDKPYFLNLFETLNSLIRIPWRVYVHFQPKNKGAKFFASSAWFDPHVPRDKTIIILDATADEKLLPTVLKKLPKDIIVHDFAPVIHKSKLVQVPNSLFSKKTLQYEKGIISAVNYINQILDEESHLVDNYVLITYKAYKDKVVPKLKYPPRLVGHYFGLRGLNDYMDAKLYIFLGTPLLSPDDLNQLALNLALDYTGKEYNRLLEYIDRYLNNEDQWLYYKEQLEVVYPMFYEGEYDHLIDDKEHQELRAFYFYNHFIESELRQAIGRSRYVLEKKTIYLLSKYPIIKPQFEIRELKRKERSDSRYEEYRTICLQELKKGEVISNPYISKLVGISRQKGLKHWKRFLDEYGNKLSLVKPHIYKLNENE